MGVVIFICMEQLEGHYTVWDVYVAKGGAGTFFLFVHMDNMDGGDVIVVGG